MDETLLVTKENGILTIKFNNQKSKNSITNKMMIKWRELLVSAKTDDSINIIYLTGVGENFTSGNDFNNFQEGIDNGVTLEGARDNWSSFMELLITHPKILVVGINGMCVGMGVTILPHVDFVFCSDTAFFFVPFIQTFQSPEGCSTLTFPKLFGRATASHLLINGGTISAEDAKRAGLVSHIFEKASFEQDALDYVVKLNKHPIKLMMKYKEMINRNTRDELLKVNLYESEELYKAWKTPEFDEVRKKFTKKPKAKF